MVFLRPVVMRTADDASKLSLDRYDMIRAQQKDAQPPANILLPVGDSPVLPPQTAPRPVPVPAGAPPTAPLLPVAN